MKTYHFDKPEDWAALQRDVARLVRSRILHARLHDHAELSSADAAPLIPLAVEHFDDGLNQFSDPAIVNFYAALADDPELEEDFVRAVGTAQVDGTYVEALLVASEDFPLPAERSIPPPEFLAQLRASRGWSAEKTAPPPGP